MADRWFFISSFTPRGLSRKCSTEWPFSQTRTKRSWLWALLISSLILPPSSFGSASPHRGPVATLKAPLPPEEGFKVPMSSNRGWPRFGAGVVRARHAPSMISRRRPCRRLNGSVWNNTGRGVTPVVAGLPQHWRICEAKIAKSEACVTQFFHNHLSSVRRSENEGKARSNSSKMSSTNWTESVTTSRG